MMSGGVFYTLLLILPVLLAGTIPFFLKLSENRLKVVLAFSAAYLLALSFLDLIPEIFAGPDTRRGGLWIMAGFFIQVVLEFFSSGIEHGHAHIHGHKYKLPIALLAGLYLHSFIEGLPLAGIYSGKEDAGLFSFLAGITLHNIPIAIAFTGLLMHEQLTKNKILVCLVLFACMAPLGAAAGKMMMENNPALTGLTRVFTALVVGIFLHIATTIIFESSEKNHRYHISKLVGILSGAALAYFLTA